MNSPLLTDEQIAAEIYEKGDGGFSYALWLRDEYEELVAALRVQLAQQWTPVGYGRVTCDEGGPICVSEEDNEIAINQGVLSLVWGEWAKLPADVRLCRRTQPDAGTEVDA